MGEPQLQVTRQGSVDWNCSTPVPTGEDSPGVSSVLYSAPTVGLCGGHRARLGGAGLGPAEVGAAAGGGGDGADPARSAADANTPGALPVRPLSRRPQPAVSPEAVVQPGADGLADCLCQAPGPGRLPGAGRRDPGESVCRYCQFDRRGAQQA